MGIKRIVDTDFWLDDKVVDMFSPEDKLFMLYLLTNPHTTQLGIYPLNRRVMAFELGYSLETVNVLLERFEVKYNIIKYSSKSSEIAVRNYLRHSIIKGGKPVEDLLLKEILKVKDRELLRYVFDGLASYDNLNETVKKVMSTLNDNDNDNDNENDDSSTNRGRIVDDSSSSSEVYEELKKEILADKEKADKTCEWCGCKTSVLHKHHFPIPKRLGGTETVNICSNCHAEFHNREAKEFGGTASMYTDIIADSKSKRFSPPTLEEVTAYCKERKNGVDPSRWYDFYQSKGWMVGKNKMKDWKACVRTWEKTTAVADNKGNSLFNDAIKRLMEEEYGES